MSFDICAYVMTFIYIIEWLYNRGGSVLSQQQTETRKKIICHWKREGKKLLSSKWKLMTFKVLK